MTRWPKAHHWYADLDLDFFITWNSFLELQLLMQFNIDDDVCFRTKYPLPTPSAFSGNRHFTCTKKI